jgi:hypothetical protein
LLAMEDVGNFIYFSANWYNFMYILWSFGAFFPVLVCCTEKNLATLTGI